MQCHICIHTLGHWGVAHEQSTRAAPHFQIRKYPQNRPPPPSRQICVAYWERCSSEQVGRSRPTPTTSLFKATAKACGEGPGVDSSCDGRTWQQGPPQVRWPKNRGADHARSQQSGGGDLKEQQPPRHYLGK